MPVLLAPIAISGSNVYVAWADNETGHWNVFFAKSFNAGMTFKTMVISAPNKGNVVDHDALITASGSDVSLAWWTNKTGTDMPVFRASNDNCKTFGNMINLNSTG